MVNRGFNMTESHRDYRAQQPERVMIATIYNMDQWVPLYKQGEPYSLDKVGDTIYLVKEASK